MGNLTSNSSGCKELIGSQNGKGAVPYDITSKEFKAGFVIGAIGSPEIINKILQTHVESTRRHADILSLGVK